jgi:hypothetical protein
MITVRKQQDNVTQDYLRAIDRRVIVRDAFTDASTTQLEGPKQERDPVPDW